MNELHVKLTQVEADCAAYRSALEITRKAMLTPLNYSELKDQVMATCSKALAGQGGRRALRVIEAAKRYVYATDTEYTEDLYEQLKATLKDLETK